MRFGEENGMLDRGSRYANFKFLNYSVGEKKKKIFLELIWKKKGILEAAPVNFNLSEKHGFSQVDSMRRAEGSGRLVPRLVPVRTAWLVEMIIKLNLIPVRTRGRRCATAILMF